MRTSPVLIDKYLMGKEVEIDAICDGSEVFIPGIMELVERTGVHSATARVCIRRSLFRRRSETR